MTRVKGARAEERFTLIMSASLQVRPRHRVRHLAERGLTTVEYAIGLLAAAAAALVLVRIFNDNAFFQALFDWVIQVFNQVSAGL